MPIPWLAVLSNVPWSDVIRNAPKVADSAKKLWDSVARKPAGSGAAARTPVGGLGGTLPPQGSDLAALASSQAQLEAAVTELHGQMVASSELIKTLAEQNTQLVARLEGQRQRLRRLGVATALLAVVAVGLVIAVAR